MSCISLYNKLKCPSSYQKRGNAQTVKRTTFPHAVLVDPYTSIGHNNTRKSKPSALNCEVPPMDQNATKSEACIHDRTFFSVLHSCGNEESCRKQDCAYFTRERFRILLAILRHMMNHRETFLSDRLYGLRSNFLEHNSFFPHRNRS